MAGAPDAEQTLAAGNAGSQPASAAGAVFPGSAELTHADHAEALFRQGFN